MAEPAPQPQTIMDNKYELIKPIGKGKFAVVHRAKRLSDESIVAVKKISVDSMDDKARGKCLKEVRSRRPAADSRHRRASSPGEQVVGGLFFDFEAIRTRDAPRRSGYSNLYNTTTSCSTWILR